MSRFLPKKDQWFGEGMGAVATPPGSWGYPGYPVLLVAGHGWISRFERQKVDGFICDLGRILGWEMPETRLPDVEMHKQRRHVRFLYPELKSENLLSISEAKDMFIWVCARFGWEDDH